MGSRRADSRAAWPAPDAAETEARPDAAEPEAPSWGCSKVAGMGRNRHLLGGQMMMKARPITALSGMVPPPGSPW